SWVIPIQRTGGLRFAKSVLQCRTVKRSMLGKRAAKVIATVGDFRSIKISLAVRSENQSLPVADRSSKPDSFMGVLVDHHRPDRSIVDARNLDCHRLVKETHSFGIEMLALLPLFVLGHPVHQRILHQIDERTLR